MISLGATDIAAASVGATDLVGISVGATEVWAPAASGPLVSDTFNRADSTTSLGTADTGQVWTTHAGVMGIDANRAYARSAMAENLAYLDTGTTAQDVSVTLAVINAVQYPGVVARAASATSFYRFIVNSVATAVRLDRVSGGSTTLASVNVPAIVNGDALRLVCSGTSLTCFINATEVISLTDSTLSGTSAGLFAYDSGALRFDDFKVA